MQAARGRCRNRYKKSVETYLKVIRDAETGELHGRTKQRLNTNHRIIGSAIKQPKTKEVKGVGSIYKR